MRVGRHFQSELQSGGAFLDEKKMNSQDSKHMSRHDPDSHLPPVVLRDDGLWLVVAERIVHSLRRLDEACASLSEFGLDDRSRLTHLGCGVLSKRERERGVGGEHLPKAAGERL